MSSASRVALLLAFGSLPLNFCFAQSLPATASASFEMLDTNKDGVVSKYEYDSSATFKLMDSNHNYRISTDELEAILGPQPDGTPSVADRIRIADKNQDGELTDEELRRAAEMRFQWLDRNSDGNLDLAEMKAGFGIPQDHY